jgi:ketosteroid isomerase-like protein
MSTYPSGSTTPQQCLQEYERRTNTHSFAEVAPLIAGDAVYWFSDGSYRGLDAIQQAFECTWAYIRDERYAIENVHWLGIDEHTATCIYTFHWQGITPNGPAEGSGRGTTIFHKRDGHWQVTHEHLSPLSG